MQATWGAALALVCSAALAQSLPGDLRKRIDTLPPAQREQLHQRAATLQRMDATQRAAFEQRITAWDALPVDDRRRRRERWQAWHALPAAERSQLQQAAAEFAALPVQEQLDWRARYAELDDTQRRGWLLGPVLGVEWQRVQPLLQQVPPAQRAPLLQALRAMTPQQRLDLGVLAQRTPPQSRDALRRNLLAQPPARRGYWLVEQLDR